MATLPLFKKVTQDLAKARAADTTGGSTTRVVHLKKEPFDVRIDRTTEWGNPFKIGPGADRATVIAMYSNWLHARPELMDKARRELKGKVLGCWCHPLPCHGDVLAKVAES